MGIILVALVAGLFYIDYATESNWGVFSLILVAGVLALYEFYKMHENIYGKFNKIIPIALFVILFGFERVLFSIKPTADFAGNLLFIGVFVLLTHQLIITVLSGKYQKIPANYAVMSSVIYIILPLTVIYLDDFILYLIVVNKVADSAAYFGGKFFGKRKLAPNISPNKTWEGFIVALIFGALASIVFRLLSPLDILNSSLILKTSLSALVLGCVVAFFGQVGDLVESAIKRHCGVKDSGFIPGLGGVLDLIDSIIFSGLALFFAKYVLYLL